MAVNAMAVCKMNYYGNHLLIKWYFCRRTWKLHLSVDTRSHPFPPRCHLNSFPARWKGVCVCAKKEIGPLLHTNWGVIGPSGPKSIPKAPLFLPRTSYCDVRETSVLVFCVIFVPRRGWRHAARIEPRAKNDARRKQVCFVLQRGGRGARDPTHARAGLFVYIREKVFQQRWK
jgi:hypothetical protein